MGLRILIVDDNAVVRAELADLLRLLGGVVIAGEAADGREALEQCAALNPDVVLMDLVMPGMNGIDATRQIKMRGLARCVIILTVYGGDANESKALAAGADAFLIKGTDLASLAQVLDRLSHQSDQPVS